MILIQIKNLTLSYGDQILLDQINLSIEEKDRIALVGRNGAGKSTLLKLLLGLTEADEGEIQRRDGLIINQLEQQVPAHLEGTIKNVIARGDHRDGELLSQYYSLVHRDEDIPDTLQTSLNETNAWQLNQRVKTLLSKFSLDENLPFSELSGGQKRRALLARSLVNEPDILLLDEPTNHLDIDTIEWMEKMLKGLNSTLLIVSHDRSFINNLATSIIDLDRGKLTHWPGNYQAYYQGKIKALEDELNHDRAFDKKLAQEEAWIRQGIQARRTRNEGRVRALKKMRQQRSARRHVAQAANFDFNQASKSGQLVTEVVAMSYATNAEHVIIKNLNTTILRGDKIGIICPNGCGKSTLIKLLTGELKPTEGTIKLGTQLVCAYLDQNRSSINNDQSLIDNIAQGRSEVVINGKPVHIMSYIQEFLFSPDRARAPASTLSGGERNRLALARLFTTPFNLLILDEPTNDLDIDTLELLEQRLVDYSGTLLLVSHDRSFLNNIVTSTLVFNGQAKVEEYIGGYDDWLRQRSEEKAPAKSSTENTPTQKPPPPPGSPQKLSYKLKRELEQLPAKIEQLEADLETLQNEMAQPDFYQQPSSLISQASVRLEALQHDLNRAYQRWEELEAS